MSNKRWHVCIQEVWERLGTVVAETAEEAEAIARNEVGGLAWEKEFSFGYLLGVTAEEKCP